MKLLIILLSVIFFVAQVHANTGYSKKFAAMSKSLNGKIFVKYNNYLKTHPTVEGKVVFEITVSQEGKLERCEVKFSELNAAVLEKQICEVYASRDYPGLSTTRTTFFYESHLLRN